MKTIISIFSLLIFGFMLTVTAHGQNTTPPQSSASENRRLENDKPLKIKKRPPPRLGTCSESAGHVALNVTFDKSAKITNIEMVSSTSCQSFEKKAVEAAKKITFEPEIKNGEPITVVKRVDYSYFSGSGLGK